MHYRDPPNPYINPQQFQQAVPPFEQKHQLGPSTLERNVGGSVLLEKTQNEAFQPVFTTHTSYQGSEMISVALGTGQPTFPPAVVTDRFAHILGRAQWGSGGTSFEALFDWKQGSIFSVNGNSLVLSAALVNNTANSADSILVKGSMLLGTNPSRAQLTRTFPQVTLADATSTSIEIPPFAHSVYIYSVPSFFLPGSAIVRFAGGQIFTIGYLGGDQVFAEFDGSVFQSDINEEDGLRFPEPARFVQIFNQFGSALPLTVMFTLSL